MAGNNAGYAGGAFSQVISNLLFWYLDKSRSSSWESNCAVATLCASLKEAHNRLTMARLVKRRRHLVFISIMQTV